MTRSVRLRLSAGLVAGVVTAAVPIVAATASASSGPGPDTRVKVQQGISATALPGATPFANTPANTLETVSFVLRERNHEQLAAAVTHGMDHYLSVSRFADQYGQSPAVVSALMGYLGQFGIAAKSYADNIDVVAVGTASQFNQALSVTQRQYHVPAMHARGGSGRTVPAQNVHAATGSPELPEHLAKYVLSVLGLSNYSPFGSQTAHVNTKVVKRQASSSDSCLQLTGLPNACNLPADFASNYGLSPLYNKGADGSGQTVAIVTLASLDKTAPEYFWKNVAGIPDTGRTVTVLNVDNGPGAPSDASGSGETDLDVEQSGALAPGANVLVYQAPNTDFGFADAYFAAASQNVASSVSTSWGESETYLADTIATGTESPGYEAAFDEVFLEMAAQGQSNFAASGDWGAYTASIDLGTTNLSVGASDDSPYVTAAGGTTLPWSATLENTAGDTATVNVPSQRTWAWDYLWQPIATLAGVSFTDSALSQVTGSGGGFSAIEPRPSYQSEVPGMGRYHAVQYLTPTDYVTLPNTSLVEPTNWDVNPTPHVTTGYSGGRAEPDLSADADPYSGYLLYEPSAVPTGNPALQGGWGGTSFVAPQLNGSTAVIDSFLGHRVGFWNPAIYAFATSRHSPFTALNKVGTSNNNLFYTGNPGSVYNEGTGLGIPNLSRLASDFAYRS
jgi:subtilase family serine protease